MGAGRRAAKSVAAWLQSGKAMWPVTKADADAFVPGAPVGVRPTAEATAESAASAPAAE
jgi:hypothetical protein